MTRVFGRARRCAVADAGDAAVADRDGAHHRVARVDRVNAAVDEIQILRGRCAGRRTLSGLLREQRVGCAGGQPDADSCRAADELPS